MKNVLTYLVLLFCISALIALVVGAALSFINEDLGLIVAGCIFGWLVTESLFNGRSKKGK